MLAAMHIFPFLNRGFWPLKQNYNIALLMVRILSGWPEKKKSVFSQILDCKQCFSSDGEGMEIKPGKTFLEVGGGRQGVWEIEEKGRPSVELPTVWRISFAAGMKRAKPRVPLLNWADFPKFWPFWVWHSYLKVKFWTQEVGSTKVLSLLSKRQTKLYTYVLRIIILISSCVEKQGIII